MEVGVSWAVGHLWGARKGAREGLKFAEKMDLGPTDSQERLGLVVRSRRTQQHLKTHPVTERADEVSSSYRLRLPR